MTGREFIKRVQKFVKKQGVISKLDQKRGKGSHVSLYYDSKFTIVRNPKVECNA